MKLKLGYVLYDITDFKHPGGDVIRTYAWNEETRIDASNVFHAFHGRSNKAHRTLQSISSITLDVQEVQRPEELELNLLRKQLIKDGYFKPSGVHVAYRIVSNGLLWWASSFLFSNGWCVLAIILMSVNYVQCGWIQHECGHKSFTGNSKWDCILQTVYLNILMGGNKRFWNDQHFSHHANTQNINHDKDLKTHPLVAFDNKLVSRKGHTWFTKRQHFIYWWLVNPLVWMAWSFVSHPMFAYYKKHTSEYVLTKTTSLTLYCMYFTYACGVGTVTNSLILFHLVSLLGTCLLLATFTVSHTTTGAYESHRGWVEPASHHTVNIYDNLLTNWWMGYLNFQIEHHLFPTMPQFRQNEVGKKYVKPFFTKHSIPYNEMSFWKANVDVYHNLKIVSNAKNDKVS